MGTARLQGIWMLIRLSFQRIITLHSLVTDRSPAQSLAVSLLLSNAIHTGWSDAPQNKKHTFQMLYVPRKERFLSVNISLFKNLLKTWWEIIQPLKWRLWNHIKRHRTHDKPKKWRFKIVSMIKWKLCKWTAPVRRKRKALGKYNKRLAPFLQGRMRS